MDNFLQSIVNHDKIDEIRGIINSINPSININLLANYLKDNENNLNGSNKDLTKYVQYFYNLNDYNLNCKISEILGLLYDKYNFNYQSLLFSNYDNTIVDNAVTNIKNNGYYQFDFLLPNRTCDNILNGVKNVKFIGKTDKKTVKGINLSNNGSSTYWVINQSDIVNIEDVQNILIDPYILNISQKYLETTPINSQTNLWYSIANNKGDTTQVFHQDFGDIKFLKIFIYLTDVNIANGPHTYIKNSIKNKILPPNYKPSQRLSTDWVNKYYKDDIMELTGKKGSILFVDTHGFHKGGTVLEDHRIILQLEYTCSTAFIGQTKLQKCNIKMNEDMSEKVGQYPKTFIKYRS